MKPPFLILETGQPVASMRRHGGFPHWIRVAAGLGADEAIAVDIERGEPLPTREGFAGVLVTGSGAMVTDRLGWSEAAAGWLREAAHAGLPVFGICYGHQLLAHALGGRVDDNPRGREMGTVAIELHPEAQDDPLFRGLPERFPGQATHMQSVLALPEGAVRLASSGLEDMQAFRWGDRAWGVQFHPEFSTTHMHGYLRARREALRREGLDPRALHAAVTATPHARRVLRRFVGHARTLAATNTGSAA